MLTAGRNVIDRVVGLQLGTDDFVVKSFEPRELLARVRSVLRRTAVAPAPPPNRRPRRSNLQERLSD